MGKITETYHEFISQGVKNADQLAQYLNERFEVEETDDRTSDHVWVRVMKQTMCANGLKTNKLKLLKVLRNEKSEPYYAEWGQYAGEDDILVILDEQSDYVSSNSPRLGLELLLARGIDEGEYKNRTANWKGYENWLKIYCGSYLGIECFDED